MNRKELEPLVQEYLDNGGTITYGETRIANGITMQGFDAKEYRSKPRYVPNKKGDLVDAETGTVVVQKV